MENDHHTSMLQVSHFYIVLGSLLFYEPFEQASGFAKAPPSLTCLRFLQQSGDGQCKRASNILRTASQGCSIELADPDTGCKIVLVGCFHRLQIAWQKMWKRNV